MFKKTLIYILIFLTSTVFASTKIQLEALENFSTNNPSATFSAKIANDVQLDEINLSKDDIINCTLNKTTAPKRAKMDAKIYFNLLNYQNEQGEHAFSKEYVGKYKSEILIEKVKNTSPKKVIKSTAGAIGNHYVPGVSQAISFVDGVVTNEEENRLKSGFVQVYKDSPLSYVEKGEEVEIKKGDIFYLLVK
ncbi:MAG: hypothetical protein IJD57_03980 [Candidatus Gastranaerophilales bacterium]|nr:hypothetical protein [Candidatus Gastranaerophilales bacterium]